MKYILLLTALFTSQAFAADLKLFCTASYNAEKVLEGEVVLKNGVSGLKLGGVEEYDFILSSKANDVVELQALNVDEPSRSYSKATMKGVGSIIELTIWKRETIVEIRCTAI